MVHFQRPWDVVVVLEYIWVYIIIINNHILYVFLYIKI
jgi:hypothetical protein